MRSFRHNRIPKTLRACTSGVGRDDLHMGDPRELPHRQPSAPEVSRGTTTANPQAGGEASRTPAAAAFPADLPRLDPLVTAALELFRTRPEERWTAESLARELGTSRPVLNRRFHAALGEPPLRVLRDFRMKRAGNLLRETDAGLAAIADAVGYDSEFALSRAFYRHFGVRPGAWRRAAQSGANDVTRCAA